MGVNLGVTMKCPACDKMLKRVEGVCGEYICINPECLENKKAPVQGCTQFYGLTQADINEKYRKALTKKQEGEIAKHQNKVNKI